MYRACTECVVGCALGVHGIRTEYARSCVRYVYWICTGLYWVCSEYVLDVYE
uniref:Uncharacterized protein n=1 Tax=Loa loa TaxID=7209 RepID=A0A1I7VJK4_LOALO